MLLLPFTIFDVLNERKRYPIRTKSVFSFLSDRTSFLLSYFLRILRLFPRTGKTLVSHHTAFCRCESFRNENNPFSTSQNTGLSDRKQITDTDHENVAEAVHKNGVYNAFAFLVYRSLYASEDKSVKNVKEIDLKYRRI